MTTISDNLATKTAFARLTPSMTREQIKRNLIAALDRSGFTIQPSPKQKNKGGQHD